ncbi:hypothetical protein KC19_VG322500 [Ceratodon purpureus]|uniref:Uncharacterized protein n=1 Tax=Ceratodon purpureus TaxID=3225 RepID=A0A8T0HWU9_CERPU|nr:hypothetical protein KC19_VG322500 [Ceratodon purpureus]
MITTCFFRYATSVWREVRSSADSWKELSCADKEAIRVTDKFRRARRTSGSSRRGCGRGLVRCGRPMVRSCLGRGVRGGASMLTTSHHRLGISTCELGLGFAKL